MSFLGLVAHYLWRNRLRTAMTMLSVLAAFVIFGVSLSLGRSLDGGVELSGADRMLTMHKRSMNEQLPRAYYERLQRIDGVGAASFAVWFGGVYRDSRATVTSYAVDPLSYLSIYSDLVLAPADFKAWHADRNGILVGESYAKQHGWKVGDRVPLQSTLWARADGTPTWEFTVRGVFTGAEAETDTKQILIHYDLLNESRVLARDTVGWFVFRALNDPDGVAKRIDTEFANSFAETVTSSEQAFLSTFAKQIGNVGAIIASVLVATLLSVLMVAGNAFAISVRERAAEIALMKTLGFNSRRIFAMIVAEALMAFLIPGVLGLWLSALLITVLRDSMSSFLQPLRFTTEIAVVGLTLMLVLALVVSLIPALRMMQLRIVDGLGRS